MNFSFAFATYTPDRLIVHKNELNLRLRADLLFSFYDPGPIFLQMFKTSEFKRERRV